MKRLLMILLVLVFMLTLIGCGDKPVTNGDNNTENGNNIIKEHDISDDWTDLEFVLGNEKYSFPLYYQMLNSKSWQLEKNDELPTKKLTFESYEMWNSNFYDEKQDLYAYIYVDFQNYENEAKKMKDCKIWSIFLCRFDDSGKEIEKGYEIKLAKGIKWGSTEEEIVAAYGEVEEGDRIDGGVSSCILVYYSIIDDMMVQMNLFIGYEEGLFMAELAQYPLE